MDDAIPTPSTSDNVIKKMDPDVQKLLYGLLGPSIVGLPGNLLAIAVASRKQNRQFSPSVYIIAMGIADTVYLLDVVWFVVYQILFDEGMLLEYITLSIRINTFIAFTSGTLSSIFLSAMSVDRLLAVRFPMKATTLCTAYRAKVAVIMTSVLIIVINVHLFYVVQYHKDQDPEESEPVIVDCWFSRAA